MASTPEQMVHANNSGFTCPEPPVEASENGSWMLTMLCPLPLCVETRVSAVDWLHAGLSSPKDSYSHRSTTGVMDELFVIVLWLEFLPQPVDLSRSP